MAIIKVRNPAIDLDAAEIPNLDANKITTGTFDDARMPSTVLNSNVDLTNLSATNLTSGTVSIARLGTSGTKDATTFLRGDNTFAAAGGGGMMELVTRTAITSTISNVEFTNLEANNYHRFVFQAVDSTNDGGEDFAFQLSTDNGSSYISSDYNWTYFQHYGSGTNNQTAATNSNAIYIADGFHTSGFREGLNGEMTINNIGNNARPLAWFQSAHKADGTTIIRATYGAGYLESNVSVNAIKFFFDTGSITGSSNAFINHYKGIIA